MSAATLGFDWAFIDEISLWALGLGVLAAVLGSVLTRSGSFAVGCGLAVCADMALVYTASHRARRELAENRIDTVAPILMVVVRLLVKAGLLGVAFAWPGVLSFPGTVTGVLVFDVTLAFVGSALAIGRGSTWLRRGR